ncbi:lysine--tRNA ligase [Ureaplasma miroungigenitalium]|uniref:Lysine--tRNA ligase n=1 Tax=Ureaplasma miroungigenitalium TaxID=1042321 RepID=A0ABT3BMH7_9BACT|nr:lysine--tRNA ligase [Ureaplasma miroungigenitalium]MCV3728459.1 lysine--tRNA ligase [Ureaplasma miroungigenitalium]MCV3734246.1 lysine--tRNA ligase [Ureaplasma miroungigenitalium]
MERKLSDQEIIRREKLAQLQGNKQDPFAITKVKRTHDSAQFVAEFNHFTKEELHEQTSAEVVMAGRLMNTRRTFGIVADFAGKFQIYINKKELSSDVFEAFNALDIGDFVEVHGTAMKTNTQELTLNVTKIILISKCLNVLPEKYHGLVDEEIKARHRYLDLIMNDESKQTFVMRSKIIQTIRNFLDTDGYLEVETPVLNDVLGGAAAKPFITFHNTLSKNYYLRIATEIALKKCIVGGFEKVYEIGRIFRNEGMDSTHNPEFTSLELYAAYEDLDYIMDLTENLIKHLVKTLKIENVFFRGFNIDLNQPFKKQHMVDLIKEYVGVDFYAVKNDEEALALADKYEVKYEKHQKTYGHIINLFFEKFVEEKLIQPTFVYGHPLDVSPLTKKCVNDPRFTERFELFIGQKEFANAYAELNDPIDQRTRFMNQIAEKDLGNDEANELDEEFLYALEYGMPPTGGLGIGIDRLIMLLTNNDSIRNVLLFPHMKDRNN